MKKLLNCRRSLLAILGMVCLTSMALAKGMDTSASIAAIVMAVAASNSYEKSKTKGQDPQ